MSNIEWTDATWNPIAGCTRVSAGCRHCYAERMTATRLAHLDKYEGLAVMRDGEPRWTGEIRFHPDVLDQPLRWRKPRRVFVCSMSDLFHEGVSDEQIAAVFGVMAAAPDHTFQVLTKRPERAVQWFKWVGRYDERLRGYPLTVQALEKHLASFGIEAVAPTVDWPLPNVWLGTSVEDQATADERIPHLLRSPAAVRFVSYEPALGPVDFDGGDYDGPGWLRGWHCEADHHPYCDGDCSGDCPVPVQVKNPERVDWVICGGESGPHARPAHPQWFRDVRDQCAEAGVAFFMKQMGRHLDIRASQEGFAVGSLVRFDTRPVSYEYHAFSLLSLKGDQMREWPEDLRVREYPA